MLYRYFKNILVVLMDFSLKSVNLKDTAQIVAVSDALIPPDKAANARVWQHQLWFPGSPRVLQVLENA